MIIIMDFISIRPKASRKWLSYAFSQNLDLNFDILIELGKTLYSGNRQKNSTFFSILKTLIEKTVLFLLFILLV